MIAFGIELFWIYGIPLDAATLLVFGAGLVVAGAGVGVDVRQGEDEWPAHVVRGAYALLVVFFLGAFVYGLFPSEIVQGDAAVNVVGHAAGFVGGSVVSYITKGIRYNDQPIG